MGKLNRARSAMLIGVLAVVTTIANASAVSAAPRLVVFGKSVDDSTLVTSYRLDIFADGANPATATRVAWSDLGKPTADANGDITVDRQTFFTGLAPAAYVATVSAVGPGGEGRGGAVNFTTIAAPLPTVTFIVSPTTIVSGQATILSWNSANALSVAINQGIGTVAASGTRSVSPTATTTYTLTATNAAGSVTATALVTVTRTAPTITWTTPATIIYGTALGAAQLNATASTAGTMAYTPPAGTVLTAGGSQALSVTFTPTNTAAYNPATKTVPITVSKATPIITWPTPLAIESGTPLTATQLNATAGVAGTFVYSPANGTVLGVGVSQTLSVAFTPTSTANYNIAAGSVSMMVTTATAAGGNTPGRANSYDDAWQGGADGWVANARAILAGATNQTPGLVFWIGDSLTRDSALGAWAQHGAGKTAEDQAITDWMHAGLSPQGISSLDGFALATLYLCSARSFTVGDGWDAADFMGSSMPPDTNPSTARLKLQDCASYPNALNLSTMLAGLPPGQFAIPEVTFVAGTPGVFTDLQRMVDLMIANHVVPIIVTYTYSADASLNQQIESYNTALVQYAQSKKLPLIDLNREMLARLPLAQWSGRFLAAGGVYTAGTTQFPASSDPYASGGSAATHTTGLALTYDGYGLKGWLGVQKMKEIKGLVIDDAAATLSSVAVSNLTSAAATITWTTSVAASSRVDYGATSGYGASATDASLAIAHSLSLTGLLSSTSYHYKVTSQPGTGAPLTSADLVFTTAVAPLTVTNTTASNIMPNSATVSWTTNIPSSSRVDYGVTTAYGASLVNATLVTAHGLGMTGLIPATTYHYKVTSQGTTGNPLSSGDFTLTTVNVRDTVAPTVSTTAPSGGSGGVASTVTVNATFSEAMNAATITAASFVLRNAAGATVTAPVNYNATTRVATLTPSASLNASTTYTATIGSGSAGVKDAAGNALAANFVWSFTTAATTGPATLSIWSAAATPAAVETGDVNSLELGLQFGSEVAGKVTGVRFYKGITTTGTHTGTLWSGTGVQLATATFTGETASGWQTVTFSTPVSIKANTVYVVSYHTSVGNYANTRSQFATAGVDNAPLHAPATGIITGGNGVYIYGARAFPNKTYQATNYWVDVLFIVQ
jgi:hypothetical protein